MIRPQRVRIIGSISGCVTLKKPLSETSMTRCHCSALMPGNTASSWMPALLTRIWTAQCSSSASSAARVAAASVTSKAIACAWPPAATISRGDALRGGAAAIGVHVDVVSGGAQAPANRGADAAAAAGDQRAHRRLCSSVRAGQSASSTTAARPLSNAHRAPNAVEFVQHRSSVAGNPHCIADRSARTSSSRATCSLTPRTLARIAGAAARRRAPAGDAARRAPPSPAPHIRCRRRRRDGRARAADGPARGGCRCGSGSFGIPVDDLVEQAHAAAGAGCGLRSRRDSSCMVRPQRRCSILQVLENRAALGAAAPAPQQRQARAAGIERAQRLELRIRQRVAGRPRRGTLSMLAKRAGSPVRRKHQADAEGVRDRPLGCTASGYSVS